MAVLTPADQGDLGGGQAAAIGVISRSEVPVNSTTAAGRILDRDLTGSLTADPGIDHSCVCESALDPLWELRHGSLLSSIVNSRQRRTLFFRFSIRRLGDRQGICESKRHSVRNIHLQSRTTIGAYDFKSLSSGATQRSVR
jgi:hypothetical protein